MSSEPETRLTELESRLAHHEHSADEISDLLAEQARLLADLSQRLTRLTDRVATLEAGQPGPPDDRPPPHY